MTVGDLMTRTVVTIRPEENLQLIEGAMERFRFRHLPVVDDGKLVGLVTHRDVLRASASAFEPRGGLHTDNIRSYYFVADLMTRDVATVRPETTVVEAARILDRQKYGCLPVTDDHNDLLGIVTEADFVKLVTLLL